MDARVSSRAVRRGLGVLFGLATQVLFALTVWGLFWFLRDGVDNTDRNWWWIDVSLALQFAVVHSVLLLPQVRARICQGLASELYGCLFCVATCGSLWLTLFLWQGSTTMPWQATGWAAAAIHLAYYGSWLALVYSLSLSGIGYQTGWTQWRYWMRGDPLPRRGLVSHGAYRWLRHPAYLSFLGMIWFTPRMSLDHTLLTGVWTAYIFVGSYLKDQRLGFYLGQEYWNYAARVPGYPLMFFGPLGTRSWPRTSAPADRAIERRAA